MSIFLFLIWHWLGSHVCPTPPSGIFVGKVLVVRRQWPRRARSGDSFIGKYRVWISWSKEDIWCEFHNPRHLGTWASQYLRWEWLPSSGDYIMFSRVTVCLLTYFGIITFQFGWCLRSIWIRYRSLKENLDLNPYLLLPKHVLMVPIGK